MPSIAAAHGIPYVATASVAFPKDIENKVKKALSITGPKYMQIHSPCPLGWRSKPQLTIQVARLAVQTGLYPIFRNREWQGHESEKSNHSQNTPWKNT